jgi:hypothetical protein
MSLNTFKNYPLNHSLDKKAIKNFIQLADPEVKEICKKIFDNTMHISFELFLTRFNICIKEFLNFYNSNRPIYILIDNIIYNDFQFKSNYWLYYYFQNYIKRNTIIIYNIDNKLLKNNDTILIIDDCAYTGAQIVSSIENMNNKYKLKLNYYILVPFISKFAYDNILKLTSLYIKDFDKYFKIFINKNIIYPLTCEDILTIEEIDEIGNYYPRLTFFYGTSLIYFDHKLADYISTITLFYNGVVPNQKNKRILEEFQKEFSTKLRINSNQLDIVPVIKNCKKYINNFNINSPKCPYPPYKKNFLDEIKEIKKTKNIKSLSFNKTKYEKKIKSF